MSLVEVEVLGELARRNRQSRSPNDPFAMLKGGAHGGSKRAQEPHSCVIEAFEGAFDFSVGPRPLRELPHAIWRQRWFDDSARLLHGVCSTVKGAISVSHRPKPAKVSGTVGRGWRRRLHDWAGGLNMTGI